MFSDVCDALLHTRDVVPMLVQCWATVYYADPTLNQHWLNVRCFLNPAHVAGKRASYLRQLRNASADKLHSFCMMLGFNPRHRLILVLALPGEGGGGDSGPIQTQCCLNWVWIGPPSVIYWPLAHLGTRFNRCGLFAARIHSPYLYVVGCSRLHVYDPCVGNALSNMSNAGNTFLI